MADRYQKISNWMSLCANGVFSSRTRVVNFPVGRWKNAWPYLLNVYAPLNINLHISGRFVYDFIGIRYEVLLEPKLYTPMCVHFLWGFKAPVRISRGFLLSHWLNHSSGCKLLQSSSFILFLIFPENNLYKIKFQKCF